MMKIFKTQYPNKHSLMALKQHACKHFHVYIKTINTWIQKHQYMNRQGHPHMNLQHYTWIQKNSYMKLKEHSHLNLNHQACMILKEQPYINLKWAFIYESTRIPAWIQKHPHVGSTSIHTWIQKNSKKTTFKVMMTTYKPK